MWGRTASMSFVVSFAAAFNIVLYSFGGDDHTTCLTRFGRTDGRFLKALNRVNVVAVTATLVLHADMTGLHVPLPLERCAPHHAWRPSEEGLEGRIASSPSVYEEFTKIGNDTEDAIYQKYLGQGAKTKLRSMADLLKTVGEHVDAQVAVEEFNVVVEDKKKLHGIFTVCSAWFRTGAGESEAFVTTFKEVCVLFYAY